MFKKKISASPTAAVAVAVADTATAPPPPPPRPVFKSAFAVVQLSRAFNPKNGSVPIISVTCSDPDAQTALQHRAAEIVDWSTVKDCSPATLTCMLFAMMTDMSFVPVGPTLKSHDTGGLTVDQAFMFTRAQAHDQQQSPSAPSAPSPSPSATAASNDTDTPE
jgi:hypothetical protein